MLNDGEEIKRPSILTITAPDGRTIFKIDAEGNVTGEVRDATEAAQVFAKELERAIQNWPIK